MPNKVNNGWIAPKPSGVKYDVEGQSPTGVFVESMFRYPPTLHYAGAGTEAGEPFILPWDPDFLRDIAAAIVIVADELEERERLRRE